MLLRGSSLTASPFGFDVPFLIIEDEDFNDCMKEQQDGGDKIYDFGALNLVAVFSFRIFDFTISVTQCFYLLSDIIITYTYVCVKRLKKN